MVTLREAVYNSVMDCLKSSLLAQVTMLAFKFGYKSNMGCGKKIGGASYHVLKCRFSNVTEKLGV